MINELWKHSSIAQELFAEGRKEGELRMAQIALERRLGKLDETLLQALGQVDTTTLEDLVADTTLTIEQLKARIGFHQ
jgi:hypothetical protein